MLTSVPNFAVAAVLGPLLLTGLFSGHIPVVLTLVFSAAAWSVAAVIALLPRLLARVKPAKTAGGVGGRLRSAAVTLDNGIRDTGQLLLSGQWQAILGAIGYLGFDIAALIAAFAAVGGGLPLAPLIFAYVIGQLGGLIPIPAGVGGTDGGLIGAMVLYGSSLSQAAAAVLAYRLFQLGVPAVIGGDRLHPVTSHAQALVIPRRRMRTARRAAADQSCNKHRVSLLKRDAAPDAPTRHREHRRVRLRGPATRFG